jgi:N-acetylneuraminate lyase
MLCFIALTHLQSALVITGLVAPVFSPLSSLGQLNLSAIPGNAAFLNSTGVKWIFTAGSTGESVDLTLLERKALAEAWITAAPAFDMRVIVHVGSDSVADMMDMAAHAEAHGANAIAAMPPTYIRPTTMDALVATMGAVAHAAPKTPFYYYHIPIKTGVALSMPDFVAAANEAIPTLNGIKFTDPTMNEFQLAFDFRFTKGAEWRVGKGPNMLFGHDEMLIASLPYGTEGAVGTTYNFNAEVQYRILEGWNNGNVSAALFAQKATTSLISAIVGVEKKVDGAYIWKMLMDLIGQPMGPARLPYTPPTQEGREALKVAVRAWCKEFKTIAPSWCAGVVATTESVSSAY